MALTEENLGQMNVHRTRTEALTPNGCVTSEKSLMDGANYHKLGRPYKRSGSICDVRRALRSFIDAGWWHSFKTWQQARVHRGGVRGPGGTVVGGGGGGGGRGAGRVRKKSVLLFHFQRTVAKRGYLMLSRRQCVLVDERKQKRSSVIESALVERLTGSYRREKWGRNCPRKLSKLGLEAKRVPFVIFSGYDRMTGVWQNLVLWKTKLHK